MMIQKFSIWIPSLQRFHRFKELKLYHVKMIQKAILISHFEFLNTCFDILCDLSEDKNLIENLTTIDKYIILIYLRIICMGSRLNYDLTCPKCNETTKGSLDMNELIIPFRQILDTKYERIIKTQNMEFHCNLPTIKEEIELEEWCETKEIDLSDFSNIKDSLTIKNANYIKSIIINNEKIPLDIKLDDKIQIIRNISSIDMNQLKQIYLNNIIGNIFQTIIFSKSCEKCNNNVQIKLQTMNDILEFILSVDVETISTKLIHLSKNWSVNSSDILNMSLSDINIMIDIVEKAQKQTETNNDEFNLDSFK